MNKILFITAHWIVHSNSSHLHSHNRAMYLLAETSSAKKSPSGATHPLTGTDSTPKKPQRGGTTAQPKLKCWKWYRWMVRSRFNLLWSGCVKKYVRSQWGRNVWTRMLFVLAVRMLTGWCQGGLWVEDNFGGTEAESGVVVVVVTAYFWIFF